MNIPTLSQLYAYAQHKHVKIFTFLKNIRFYVNYAHVLYMYAKHTL